MSAIDILRDALFGNPPRADFKPSREGVLNAFTQLQSAVNTLAFGAVGVLKDTRANLNADLNHPADTIALVHSDATYVNNDFYIKTGLPGAGGWTLTSVLHDAVEGLVSPYLDDFASYYDAINSFVLNILQSFGTTVLIGRKGDPVAGPAVMAPLTYVENKTYASYAYVDGFNMYGWGAGTVQVAAYSKSGDVFKRESEPVDCVSSGATLQHFDLGILLQPGWFMGATFPANVGRYSPTLPTDDGGWYSGEIVGGSFTDTAPITGNARLEFNFTAKIVETTATNKPLLIVIDGNSLPAGEPGVGGSAVTPFATQLAAMIPSATIINKSVSGQNVDAMLADAASDIYPLGNSDDYFTVLIVSGEPYNQLRGGTSVNDSVAKIDQYVTGARDIGKFDLIIVEGPAAHNTSTGNPVEGSWDRVTTKDALRAAYRAKYPNYYVDHYIDMGAALALSDYTDDDFYQPDQVHYKTAIHTLQAAAYFRLLKPYI